MQAHEDKWEGDHHSAMRLIHRKMSGLYDIVERAEGKQESFIPQPHTGP
jgi:hypothetical protein